MPATVKFIAKPGKEEELKRELLAVAPLVRQEKGCTQYNVLQHLDNPNVFLVDQSWENPTDWEATQQKPFKLALAAKLDDLLADPPQLDFYKTLA
jgi:quinol monooxygenase YgiN